MRTFKLITGVITLITCSLLIWSCKDNFTQKDLLTLQAKIDSDKLKDSVALSIQVYNGTISARSSGGRSSGIQGLTGITVSIAADGKKKTATTDADGLVSFIVVPGTVSGVLKGAGVTTINFTLTITKAGTEKLTNASVALPTFETTAARAAKVSGTVTAELNLLNNTRENAPDGVAISFSPDFTSSSFLNQGSTGVSINKLSIEGTFITKVTSGAYSIDLPTSADGLNYTYAVSDFTADQQIAINNYEGDLAGSVRASATIPAVFSMSTAFTALTVNNNTTIPQLSSLQIDIDAPPAAFTTAATASNPVLSPARVDGLGTGGFTILSPGSGYPLSSNQIAVTVTPATGNTPTTNAVLYASSNSFGQIIGILGNGVDPDGAGPLAASNYGAGYRLRATLTVGGGSGTIVVPNYASTLDTYTGTNGAGYVLSPQLVVRGLDARNNSVEDASNTSISGGTVVAYFVPSQLFSSINSIFYRPAARSAASWASSDFTANTFGQIKINSGDGLTTSGSGYNPSVSPVVTIRSIRAGGTGASVFAEMSTSTPGVIANLVITDGGSGYTIVNANYPTTTTNFTILTGSGTTQGSASTPGVVTSLKPGLTRNMNFHAGTGTRIRSAE